MVCRRKAQGATACRSLMPVSRSHVPGMAPQTYYRRWEVWLRGSKLGEVFAATERAACLRAIQRFKISREEQQELEVRRAKDAEAGAMHSRF